DIKELVSAIAPRPLVAAIRAPWGMDVELREAIASLRAQGHTVVCALPGHEHEVDEFHCDRELVQVPAQGGVWTLKNI
ncbi:MAG: ATP phosphoribosyltransferase regulatory subunit, partial [Polaromonas sp.]|nr:ATP phosphoribosyltransferase regulatory subunit [Polaromonas sp.]